MNTCVPIERRFSRERGQSVVEFVIVIAVFGTLLLGIFQVALLYRAKTTVDYAAFTAARSGSLNGATQQSVDNGMIKGLAPLYATSANAGGLLEAMAKAGAAAKLYHQATAEIISPTRAMFDKVAVQQFDGVKAIPNDDLNYRSDDVRAANLLKVKVTYDYPLIVPVVDRIIASVAGGKHVVEDSDGTPRSMYVLPIQAQAIVNMQSPIRDVDALGAGNGGNPPPGNGRGNPPPTTGGGGGGPNPPLPPQPPPGLPPPMCPG